MNPTPQNRLGFQPLRLTLDPKTPTLAKVPMFRGSWGGDASVTRLLQGKRREMPAFAANSKSPGFVRHLGFRVSGLGFAVYESKVYASKATAARIGWL